MNILDFLAMDDKTKHGIDRLEISIRFLCMLELKGKKLNRQYDRFKSFLVQKLKRGIKPQEEIDMSEAMLRYVQSEPETNERLEAMKVLFGLEFLEA